MAGSTMTRCLLDNAKTAIVIDECDLLPATSPPTRHQPPFQGFTDVTVDINVWEAYQRRKKPKLFHPTNYANAPLALGTIDDICLVNLGDEEDHHIPVVPSSTAQLGSTPTTTLPGNQPPTTPTSSPPHSSRRWCWMSPRSRRSLQDHHAAISVNNDKDKNDDHPDGTRITSSRIGQSYQATVCPSLSQDTETAPTVVCDGTEGDVLWDPQRAAAAENPKAIGTWPKEYRVCVCVFVLFCGVFCLSARNY